MSVPSPIGELSEDDIANKWPLHWLVWNKDSKALNRLLEQKVVRRHCDVYFADSCFWS